MMMSSVNSQELTPFGLNRKVLVLAGILILFGGFIGGFAYERHREQQVIQSSLNNSLAGLESWLLMARNDMHESSVDPTLNPPLTNAYKVGTKLAVGQAYAIWQSIGNVLSKQEGFNNNDVFQIGEGLNIIYQNILPPGQDVPSATVSRAKTWILMFTNDLNIGSDVYSDDNYIVTMKSVMPSLVQKYRSYHNDDNFQVLPQ